MHPTYVSLEVITNKTYRQALDAMAFSEEAADRMTNDLARAIAERQERTACETTTAACKPAASQTHAAGGGRAPRLKKRWHLVAAASLAGALLVGSA